MDAERKYLTASQTDQLIDEAERSFQTEQADLAGAVPELHDGLKLAAASAIPPETPEWLWDGRIPLKAITLLIGAGGLGKTTLACDLAARVSRGQLGRPPTAVLFATTEDSLSHTLVPRLHTAGADLGRIHFVTIVEGGFENGLTLPDDIADLGTAITDKVPP